jgi:hypothetical protein
VCVVVRCRPTAPPASDRDGMPERKRGGRDLSQHSLRQKRQKRENRTLKLSLRRRRGCKCFLRHRWHSLKFPQRIRVLREPMIHFRQADRIEVLPIFAQQRMYSPW